MRHAMSMLATTLLVLVAGETQGADRTFTGVTRLSGDTNWQYGSITFEDQAVIVTNGYRLTLEGTQKITFKGTPRILSYEPRTMAPGDSGRPGGIVYLKSPLLTGTGLKIDNLGEAGAKGAAGPAGAKGAKGPQGRQREWNGWNGCFGGSDGGPGGPGADGGDGGVGGSGAAGGTIVLDIVNGCWNGGIPRFTMSVSGGQGGKGGDAGAAGPGGDGGDGAPGTFWCGGTNPGPPGAPGRLGRVGPDGGPSNPGPIIDIRLTCTPKNLKQEPGALRPKE